MIILVSSKITQSTIQSSLGKPEYSYFFLLKEFLPALQCIGEVITVTLDQVDTLYQQYREQGQQDTEKMARPRRPERGVRRVSSHRCLCCAARLNLD